MASDVVYNAVKDYLTANWTTSPLAFENEEFVPPVDSEGRPTPFVAVEVTGNVYGQQSIGASTQATNRWDEEGQLWLHVFVRTSTGSSTARNYAKTLADLFRGTTLLSGDMEFMDASIGLGEKGDDEGNYYRISVSVDWRRIEA